MQPPSSAPTTILALGGIDPSGGAGLFIDQRAIDFAGGLFCGVCSTITIQDGTRFIKSIPQPVAEVRSTLDLLFANRSIKGIKTGALGSIEIVQMLDTFLRQHPTIPLIVDPVLKSTTGGSLFSQEAAQAVKEILLPRATLIMPNLHEASFLADITVNMPAEMTKAAEALVSLGAQAVMVKGGHLSDDTVVDVLKTRTAPPIQLTTHRLDMGEVRGTGCALASLVATHIALGESVENGVKKARKQLLNAMKHSISPGSGPRILNFTNR